jgi:hypothetical protein
MVVRTVVCLAVAGGMAGCTGTAGSAWHGMAQGLVAAQPPAPGNLALYGGINHTYLGCLSCDKEAADSIFNEYGRFGSRHGLVSIRNPNSQFGSRRSPFGACNPYASEPPEILDTGGRSYGRLTVNRSHFEATRNDALLDWLETVCRG